MNQLYRHIVKIKDRYVDTLGKLYDYSTSVFAKNKFTQWFDTEEGSYTYGSFKKQADSLSKLLTQYGVCAGDKVAILSQNMPNWSAAFFSLVPFGRIAVPILPDSSENEVTNILTHSESKVLFVSKRLLAKVSAQAMERLSLVIDIETFELIKKNEDHFTCDGKVCMPMPDDIATIIYTSGTTGSAKGVVLTHRNLTANLIACYRAKKRKESDRWLSILPLPHTYEMTLSMLYPMFVGASVYYISKPPTPSILLKAMKIVKPTTMLSVPLIIEKIYRNSVVPTIRRSPTLRWMNKHMNGMMHRIIGMKLKKTFGGHLSFFGIGGAKLDPTVEEFLIKAKFPYAIGYGLTECSPLLSQSIGKIRTKGSIGLPVHGVTMQLYNPDPKTGVGEIIAKGDNIMMGYYKDPARTKEAFTEDGWFRTNDIAMQDAKGRFHIKGRIKNMILGPSGENIYPEEIENVINNMDEVNESIIVQRNGRLVALVQFNENIIDWDRESEKKFYVNLEARKKAILNYVNKHVNKFSKVNDVEVMKEPFEKTATQKIRRFKYESSAPTVEQGQQEKEPKDDKEKKEEKTDK